MRGCTPREQRAHGRVLAFEKREVVDVIRADERVIERALASVINDARVGTAFEKKLHDRCLAVARGHHQRRFSVPRRAIRIGAGIEQRCDRGDLVSMNRVHERRPAVLAVRLIGIRTGGDELANVVSVAVARRFDQRRERTRAGEATEEDPHREHEHSSHVLNIERSTP